MAKEPLKCPYCGSWNYAHWGEKYEIGIEQPIKIYRCYECNKTFEIRDIEGCGEEPFAYGDNYPIFNKREDKMDLKAGDKVRIRFDTGVYYEGEIIATSGRL